MYLKIATRLTIVQQLCKIHIHNLVPAQACAVRHQRARTIVCRFSHGRLSAVALRGAASSEWRSEEAAGATRAWARDRALAQRSESPWFAQGLRAIAALECLGGGPWRPVVRSGSPAWICWLAGCGEARGGGGRADVARQRSSRGSTHGC